MKPKEPLNAAEIQSDAKKLAAAYVVGKIVEHHQPAKPTDTRLHPCPTCDGELKPIGNGFKVWECPLCKAVVPSDCVATVLRNPTPPTEAEPQMQFQLLNGGVFPPVKAEQQRMTVWLTVTELDRVQVIRASTTEGEIPIPFINVGGKWEPDTAQIMSCVAAFSGMRIEIASLREQVRLLSLDDEPVGPCDLCGKIVTFSEQYLCENPQTKPVRHFECEASRLREQVERLTKEREGWESDALQHCRNTDFYRGVVVHIGEMFGDAAKTSDDGSVHQDVLVLKVPELVAYLTRERDEAREQVTKLERSLEAQVQLHARKADQKHEAVKRAELAEADNAALLTALNAHIDEINRIVSYSGSKGTAYPISVGHMLETSCLSHDWRQKPHPGQHLLEEIASLRTRLEAAEKQRNELASKCAHYESVLCWPDGMLRALPDGNYAKEIRPENVTDLIERLRKAEERLAALKPKEGT